jgi:hypothetical protein
LAQNHSVTVALSVTLLPTSKTALAWWASEGVEEAARPDEAMHSVTSIFLM